MGPTLWQLLRCRSNRTRIIESGRKRVGLRTVSEVVGYRLFGKSCMRVGAEPFRHFGAPSQLLLKMGVRASSYACVQRLWNLRPRGSFLKDQAGHQVNNFR